MTQEERRRRKKEILYTNTRSKSGNTERQLSEEKNETYLCKITRETHHINDAENESHLATRQNESESKQIDKGAGFAYSARKSVQNSNY